MSENVVSTETSNDTGNSPEVTEEVDWKAEAEKWKTLSRKNEEKAKTNLRAVKELESIKDAQLSEHEKALKAAREEGAQAVRAEYAQKLVATTFRASAKDRVSNPDALLAGLNLAQFTTDDGDPDEDAIAAFLDSIAPAKTDEPTEKDPADSGLFQAQGTRNTSNHLPLNGDPLLQRVNQILGIQ